MRATCEHCSQPQPRDWTAGDLCVHCGKIVRREARCFWCTAWVPAGGFCRECGAAVLEPQLYAPARMLKDAGVDRFNLPKMLAEMDPAQVENLGRIYQRQAALVARHVDDAAFLQSFLFQKHWSAALDDQLTVELPWPPLILERMSVAFARPDNALQRACELAEKSPVPLIRTLASLTRLRLDDFEVFSSVNSLRHSTDKAIRAEAALALTGWRIRYAVEGAPTRAYAVPDLVEELRNSPFRAAAAVRLALLGEKIELPMEAIGSSDPDIAMAAALATGDEQYMQTSLRGDRMERLAAGRYLAFVGNLPPLAPLLHSEPDDKVLEELLGTLSVRKKTSPDLRDGLHLVETHSSSRIRYRAANVLCQSCRPSDGMRIARASRADPAILHCLLQSSGLEREQMEEVCEYLLANKCFRMSQFGLSTVAEKGLIGDDFIPRHFTAAEDEATRIEMCSFAEEQLKVRGDEQLHRFMMQVAFGPYSARLRAAGWWGLRRWYLRTDIRGSNPAALETVAATRFFGSIGAFAIKLAAVLDDRASLLEVGLYEDCERLLKGASVASLAADERAAWTLADAVTRLMRLNDNQISFTLRTAGAVFFEKMAQHPQWRKRAVEILHQFKGSDIDHHCGQALERIAQYRSD